MQQSAGERYASRNPRASPSRRRQGRGGSGRRNARWVLAIGIEKGGCSGGGNTQETELSYRRSHQMNEPQRDRPLALHRNGVSLAKGEWERAGRGQDGESQGPARLRRWHKELLAYLLAEHEVGFSGHDGTWHNGRKRLKDRNWMTPGWSDRIKKQKQNRNRNRNKYVTTIQRG